MADFIFRANIAHYKDLLAAESDAQKIAEAAYWSLLVEKICPQSHWKVSR